MGRNYNDYLPVEEHKNKLRLTQRGSIVLTTVVFLACLVGAAVAAAYVITQQQVQLEKSQQIARVATVCDR